MDVRYREYLPAPPLRKVVLCYWTLEGTASSATPHLNRVLPDGCMDLLFELGDPVVGSGERSRAPRPWAVGAMERADVVWLAGRVELLGVRFRPGGAAAFLAPPAGELRGRVLPLDELWGGDATAFHSRLAESPQVETRTATLDRLLLGRAGTTASRATAALRASRLIADSAGTVPVSRIAEQLGMSARSLERRFEDAVGLSPREARRVVRFQNAVNLALAEPTLGLAALAVRAGYYDQAHLTREFTALAGLPPGAWRAERNAVATVQDPVSHSD